MSSSVTGPDGHPAASETKAAGETRCAVVAVVGPTNSGKSTLVNRLVGEKVSIVSPKVHTTRTRIVGIFVDHAAQIVLADTPGLSDPRSRTDRVMTATAWDAAVDADARLVVVDSTRGSDNPVAPILRGLRQRKASATLVLNKIDRVAKSELLPRTERFAQTGLFDAVFMVSALTGDGVSDLRDHLVTSAPLGPWLYPADQVTDVADAVMAAEITRERIYLLCHQELPYVATVETVGWRSGPSGSLRIEQIITVSRASQRAILLGRGGSRLKQIGEQARHELEQLFDRRVHLFLHVAVESRSNVHRAIVASQSRKA